MLNVETFTGGFDKNFTYLVWDAISKEAAILDACVNPEQVLARAKELDLEVKFLFIMHSHFDHVVGIDAYRKQGIPLYAHETLRFEGNVDLLVKHKDTLLLGEEELTVHHAPGHRFDCVMIYSEKKVFTTDVVFVGGCGRCDLEGSDPEQMYHSLYDIFMQFPDDTVVYPGHDYGDSPTSTVGEEKKSNPYLQCVDKEEFLHTRMG